MESVAPLLMIWIVLVITMPPEGGRSFGGGLFVHAQRNSKAPAIAPALVGAEFTGPTSLSGILVARLF
jgi:hypothetical protein